MLDFIHLKDLLNTLGLLLQARCNENYCGNLSRKTNTLNALVLDLFVNFVGLIQSGFFEV